MFEDADLIHSYSRADAPRDGALIGVTTTAAGAGFRWPADGGGPSSRSRVEGDKRTEGDEVRSMAGGWASPEDGPKTTRPR
jgi:hypothetical protein